MIFNSATYVAFFIVVVAIYWSLGRLRNPVRPQNYLLLLASYFFYGYWDWLLLILITSSTLVDYVASQYIERADSARKRKAVLLVSICFNLGLLALFKYYDFFAESLVHSVRLIEPDAFSDPESSVFLRLILPVGISFYTLQTMSYTIDVYRREIPAEKNLLDFAVFVCFFPQLVAGPIERAAHLLPQIKGKRSVTMEMLAEGAWLLLLGYFLKVYVADNLGEMADRVYFASPAEYHANASLIAKLSSWQVIFATYGFLIQVYCDFAGYSFIAMGSARWLGIKLSLNFDAPEFGRNQADLWRRWHITLTQWIRDYVYFPLGGNRVGPLRTYRNIILVFGLTGLWHGASWNFVLWGTMHGVVLALYTALRPYLPKLPEDSPDYVKKITHFAFCFGTFGFLALSAIPFRAYDLNQTIAMVQAMFLNWNAPGSPIFPGADVILSTVLRLALPVLILDFFQERNKNLFWIHSKPMAVRVIVYFAMAYCIMILGQFGKNVIYFAF